jgi:sugar/nucleoside kinase (ribokinase family)
MPAEVDLLVLGDANPDLILTGDVRPEFGQVEKLVDDAALVIGGSGAITACGAARLGLRVALIAVVGDDLFGRFTLDAIAERGVDTRGCRIDPHRPTGLSTILSAGTDRAILTTAGTTGELHGDLVDGDMLRSSRHVHISSFFLQHRLASDLPDLFEQAHRAGATTSIDPNFDPAGNWDGGLLSLLAVTDYLFPNATEARAIGGTGEVEAAAAALAGRGTVVVVKNGHAGAFAVAGGNVIHAGAIPGGVIDSTGAGDSFDAGFLAAGLLGWSVAQRLQLAAACGSLSTRAVGGTSAQPTLSEARAAAESVPVTSAGAAAERLCERDLDA